MNRQQFCYFDGSTSSKSSIGCGIPQGSRLGPLLFIILISENCLKSTTTNMYADDTCVNIASENLNNSKSEEINIDESLNWKEQYKTIKNKLKRGLSSLRKLKNILPQRKLDHVYKVIFENHFCYDNIVWSALSNTKLSQLQRLQTRAKKLIANAQ